MSALVLGNKYKIVTPENETVYTLKDRENNVFTHHREELVFCHDVCSDDRCVEGCVSYPTNEFKDFLDENRWTLNAV